MRFGVKYFPATIKRIMEHSKSNKKLCKCGCGKIPSISYNGWNYACAPQNIFDKQKEKRQASIKKNNARKRDTAKLNKFSTKTLYRYTPQKVKIPKQSRKMLADLKIYRVLKKDYLKDHPVCECDGCRNKSIEIHHKKGRGILLNVVEFWMAICRKHHNWIGINPKQAMGLGLTISRLAISEMPQRETAGEPSISDNQKQDDQYQNIN